MTMRSWACALAMVVSLTAVQTVQPPTEAGGDRGTARAEPADDRYQPQPQRPPARTRALEAETRSPLSHGPGTVEVPTIAAGDTPVEGDHQATSLAPSASWDTALSSGGFTWSYPMRVPDVPGGLAPQVALSYSSQAVDGRTATTNNQGSWIGEGFGYEPGYIERRYKPCADDGHSGSGEQCWAHHNATMVLAGHSGELVRVDGLANTWRLSDDDGSRIQRLTGAANGDNDGEHWKVTTTDGTQYFFGLNRLPGWSAGSEETDSTWTHTVYGDDAGDLCHHSSGFSYSRCDQGWRWNLDYVVDPRGNVISFFYEKEINHYAREGRTDVNGVSYVRGGYLTHIDYGQRTGQVSTTAAPARVVFTVADRCPAGGSGGCDVPERFICATGTRCRDHQASVTFFTTKRLTRVETQVRTGSSWSLVESWALESLFLSNSDDSHSLWLQKIVHAGHRGGATITQPAVELEGILLPNRIDRPGDSVGPLNRYRLHRIVTESGAQILVDYEDPDCTPDTLPAPESNTRRCYPVRWNPFGGGESNEILDWFHTYVVERVVQDDLVGGNPDMVTSYEYEGGAAWARAKPDGITRDRYLTWSDWRGHAQVTVRTGDHQTLPTRVDHFFLRGMGGPVTDSTGRSYTDHEDWAGYELESIVFDGSNIVSKTINEPWRHVTHTQRESWGTRESAYVATQTVRSLTALPGDRWRENRTVTSFDPAWGRPVQVDDLSPAGDRCTRTWYADNPDQHFYSYAARTQTVAVDCSTAADLATQLVSDTRTSYDGQAPGVAPTEGTPTRSETLDRVDGTTIRYVTDSETTNVDDYGRPLEVRNARDQVTTTEYTETDGLTTQVRTTNPLDHVTTTRQDPAYGVPTLVIDPNDTGTAAGRQRTEMTYDALGRLTAVWRADRNRSSGHTPSVKFHYGLHRDRTSVVTTETLQNDGTYRASHELLDGFLRPRQTQTPGTGGWLATDTLHDGTGQVWRTNAPYFVTGTAGQRPLVALDEDTDDGDGPLNGSTIHSYDGAGREVAETFAIQGHPRWSTRTSYAGDRVTVDPPDGGVPTTTVTDARGNVIEQHQAGDVTRYTYTPAGLLDTVTDPLGNTWNNDYDQRGRKELQEDPDAGDLSFTYDAAGNITSATDGRGVTLSYLYDELGRKTETWEGEVGTGTKLSEISYDTVAKGQLHQTIRHTPLGAYRTTIDDLDALYRPLTTSYEVPGVDVGSSDESVRYAFTTAYNRDGTTQSLGSPAAGGLPAEAVVTSYDDLQRPVALRGHSSYVTAATYGNLNELLEAKLDVGTTRGGTSLLWWYERGTSRLTRAILKRDGVDVADMDAHYRYDDASNVLAIADTPTDGSRDIQCFAYDELRRLEEAWATASSEGDPCAAGPEAVGGPAPYHQSWTFDAVGNRRSETIHGLDGAEDNTRSYTYPAQGQGQNQPHTVTRVDETEGPSSTYAYDAAGHTVARPDQALTWDAEGHLATSTPEGGQTTSYTYDAEGNRLVRREPGATTVYLPGMELRYDPATRRLTGTRFYTFGSQMVAVRTGNGVSFQATDHHGTALHTIDATTGALTSRRTTPYGTPRRAAAGAAPTSAAWPHDKGFISGTQDPTGLIHLGAREYDPALGRFISRDPIIAAHDPQQINGYAYSHNNPATNSDPTGLMDCADNECREIALTTNGGATKVIKGRRPPITVAMQSKHRLPPCVYPRGLLTSECSAEPSWSPSSYRESPAALDDAWTNHRWERYYYNLNWNYRGCMNVGFNPMGEACDYDPPIFHVDPLWPRLPAPVLTWTTDPPPASQTPLYTYETEDGCFVLCVGIENSPNPDEPGRTVQLVLGPFGTPGAGITRWYATAHPRDQATTDGSSCVQRFVTECSATGLTSDGSRWTAIGYGCCGKLGVQGGPSWSFCLHGCRPPQTVAPCWEWRCQPSPQRGNDGGTLA